MLEADQSPSGSDDSSTGRLINDIDRLMQFREDYATKDYQHISEPIYEEDQYEELWTKRLKRGVYERRGLTCESDHVRQHAYKFKSEELVDQIDFAPKETMNETPRFFPR